MQRKKLAPVLQDASDLVWPLLVGPEVARDLKDLSVESNIS
jgi:hypothetical protein